MAKNTQEAEVIVTMNGQAAKKAVAELAQEYERLQKEALEAYKAGNDALGKKLDAQAQKLMKDIEITRHETKKFADVMKNINGASLKELRSAAKQLQSEINKLAPGTQAFIEKSKQLQQVNTRIRQLTNEFKGLVVEEKQATFSLKGLADGFNKYFGMVTAGIAAVTGVSMAFRKAAEDAATLDDVYADVMKTTGLLHEQVADLDKELMKIDTRTSREQLLLLARDAGKLGIQGKENILGFVRAADQIQVALGEDLGEGAIKNLGKIADVFGLTKEMGIEKSLLSIASAVNALGQASTASEGYLVDFTQRLAGVGAMAGLSVQDILGFASGLDQSAMKVEMAATAFQKFLMKMYEEPAKFAGYAGMEVEAFTELLKTNANEAITIVMKAMNGQDGFAAMVPIFNEMGLDGARAVGVLSAMTKNLDAVTEAQRLANVEFAKGTSVTEEYNTKNNNLQAKLEKARKEFHNASVELGQSLNPIMLKSTKLTTYLIKALVSYGKEIKTVLIVIAALTVALKARNIAIAVGNAAMKVAHALQATGKVITLALSVAYNTLANNTTRAAAAQKMLNASMNASVFGVILTAVTGLTVGIMALTRHIKEARKEREWLSNLEKDASVEYAKQASEVTSLSKIVHNNNISLEERKRALEELKKIVPDYHADLTEEGKLIRNNTAALDDYLDNLKKTVRMEIFKESYRELQKQMIEQEKLLEEAKQRQSEALKNAGGNTQTEYYVTEYGELGGGRTTKHKTQYGEATDMVEEAEKGLKKLQSQEKEIEQQIGVVSGKVLNAMDEDIAAVNKKYNELFNEIQEQYRDNPAAGNEARQDLEKQKKDEIAAIRKKYEEKRKVENEETATTNDILSKAQFDYLQERSDKLTKKEKEMVGKEYTALSKEESQALKARYDKLMNADWKLGDQRYQEEVKNLEKRQREELNILNQSYFDKKITAEEHEQQLQDITMKYLQEKLKLAEENGKDTTQIEATILSEKIKSRQASYEEELKLLETRQKNEERKLEQAKINGTISEEDYNKELLNIKVNYLQRRLEKVKEYGQDEEAAMQALLDAEYEAAKLAMEQVAKLRKEAQDVKDSLRSPSQVRDDNKKTELEKLEQLHKAMLLSDEEYGKKAKAIEKKYAEEGLKEKLSAVEKYISQVNSIMSEASNFVSALKDAESAKLEAQYQADLTAAGDNAEKKAEIEAQYEEDKLELSKKYADTEMVINIAKTVAAGALAAIQAFAQLGPVAGGIMAAIIAATTAAEVYTIVQQRNAIKNSSVSSSSSSSVSIGQRTMTGFSEGGFTDTAANDHEVVGVVHANEYVAPAWMVRRNPVTFANLERYRKQGSHGRSGNASRGFADGGFTGTGGTSKPSAAETNAAIEEAVYKGIRAALEGEWLRAYLVRKDLTEMDAQDERFKKQTSR